jgi:tetratricopeptide (TPR) repeat protein
MQLTIGRPRVTGSCKITGMQRPISFLWLSLLLACSMAAQVEQVPDSGQGPGENQAPPRSDRDREARESSSRNTLIDLSPPEHDAKDHPNSSSSVAEAEGEGSGDVGEFHAWDPHKAAKDIEVGDFYLKRKNYKAALDRYHEALQWKPNDAVATFRMGQCLEKLKQPEEAQTHYQEYLKILPNGPLAEDARRSLERLRGAVEQNQASGAQGPR